MHRGYVKVWRKMLENGVMSNPNTASLFLWLMLMATRKPYKKIVRGELVEILPGEVIIATRVTSRELGMTERSFRTALNSLLHLEIVTRKATHSCTIVSITNWTTYQCDGTPTDTMCDTLTTRRRHADDTLTTQEQEVKKLRMREVKKNFKSIVDPAAPTPPSQKRFSPPSVEDVTSYCNERRNTVDPTSFMAFYESNGWKVGKNPMKDWKAAVRTWEGRENRGPPGKKQGGGWVNHYAEIAKELRDEQERNGGTDSNHGRSLPLNLA